MAVVTQDGFRVESTTESEADLRAVLDADKKGQEKPVEVPVPEPAPEPEPEPVEAAVEDTSAVSEKADQSRDETGKFAKDEKKGKSRSSAERMLEAIKEKNAERARADVAEQRMRELEARLAGSVQPPTSHAVGPTGDQPTRPKPTVTEVGTKYVQYEDFLEDLSDWKAEQRIASTLAERDRQIEHAARERAEREAWQATAERVTAAKAKYEDWDEAAERIDTAFRVAGLVDARGGGALPPAMQQAVLASEQSGDILYFLGTHPEDALQIARQAAAVPESAAPFIRQVLESKVAGLAGAVPGSVASPVSSAKPPIKPVGSSPIAAALRADDEALPFQDFFRAGNEAERQRRRSRRGA